MGYRASPSAVMMTATLLLASAAGGTASAAPEIGRAATVEKTVTGAAQGRKLPMAQNDAVFQEEVVQTAAESLARLKFRDETQLFVGPSSSVKLDRFVYNPDGTASKIVLNASKGAFRFVSGRSDHTAYEIRTPFGSLGVRGTVLGFVIAHGRLVAVLKQGAMIVCPHRRLTRSLRGCIPVTQAEMGVVVTRASARGPVPKTSDMADFGDLCGALCKRLFPP